MGTLTETQIEKAVNWWATAVQAPTFDDGTNYPISQKLAQMNVVQVPEEQIELFKTTLRKKLEERGDLIQLYFEYKPAIDLAEVLEESGVEEYNIPWKTHMYFHAGQVIVRSGATGKPVEL